MTRAEIKKRFRFLTGQSSTASIKDASDSLYDANDLAMEAYNQYAVETRCFKASYTKAAVSDQSEYAHSFFGTSSAGARIFEPRLVAYNSLPLTETTEDALDKINPYWRFQGSGTPLWWIKWGDGKVKLYPTPSGTSNIYIEGYEIPDPATFDDDTEIPAFHAGDHKLLSVWMAIVATVHNPADENQLRQNPLYSDWQAGIENAKTRIHGIGRASVQVGEFAGIAAGPQPLQMRITPAV